MYKLKLTKDFILSRKKNILFLKGKLGENNMIIPSNLLISFDKNYLYIDHTNTNDCMLNTFLSHLKINLKGISQGYKKQIQLKGVGYKWFIQTNELILQLGFSHLIKLNIPENIYLKVFNKETSLILRSTDLIVLTKYIAYIRHLKKPEIYKGKGILYKNEIISLKEGKKNKK